MSSDQVNGNHNLIKTSNYKDTSNSAKHSNNYASRRGKNAMADSIQHEKKKKKKNFIHPNFAEK